MNKTRLEAFSDGVLAIIITIMVLEIKVPHDPDWKAMVELWPKFLSYTLSFLYVGIYWNNHHHLLHAVRHVNGQILWANLHLLFWLSLLPFGTGWSGENHFAQIPVAVYGFILLMAGLAFFILSRLLVRAQGEESELKKALGRDIKGQASLALYVLGLLSSYFSSFIAMSLYTLVAAIWLVPDRRIEGRLGNR